MNEDEDQNKKAAWTTALVVLYGACLGAALFQILTLPPEKSASAKETPRMSMKRDSRPSVAVVPIYGTITIGEDGPFTNNGTDRLNKRLKEIGERDDVKAVVLRINSPGGSVGAVQEVCDEIEKLKASGKTVVASMGDIAASGGYYIAASADKIYANPGTLTGSIGVIFELANVEELIKKIGVKVDPIKSSVHKDIGSPFRAMSQDEKIIMQSVIDDAYGQFVDAVAKGRKMDREQVKILADGRIYSGTQAKSNGLIDELGNLEAAIAKAAELSGIKGKPKILYEEVPWERFLQSFSQSSKQTLFRLPGSQLAGHLAYLWQYSE